MTPVAPTAVYLLCLVTSVICAALLIRAWRSSRTRLLLWTAASFGFLALNNLILVADLVFLPATDLWVWRQAAAALGLGVLIWGFVWEADR